MKRALSLTLVLALLALGVPAPSMASAAGQQAPGQIAGGVRHESGKPAVNYAVRVRNAGTGQIAGAGTSGPSGEFTFAGLPPGTYVVEVLDNAGRIVATSTSIALGTGAMEITGLAITLTETEALAAAAAGGSFFKSTTGILVMAGAAAAATGGIVMAKKDKEKKKEKSPSK